MRSRKKKHSERVRLNASSKNRMVNEFKKSAFEPQNIEFRSARFTSAVRNSLFDILTFAFSVQYLAESYKVYR